MKYILSLLLGVTSAVWGMEDTAGERRVDINRFAGTRVSYPTCLNTSAKDGYSLESTLSIRRNCLNFFVKDHITEIKVLGRLGLFKGQVDSYNEEVMTILRGIFSNDNKENLQRSIPGDFLLYPTDFIDDLIDLRNLIKGIETQPEPIKIILKDMRKNFIFLNGMIVYCQDHFDEYRARHQ